MGNGRVRGEVEHQRVPTEESQAEEREAEEEMEMMQL